MLGKCKEYEKVVSISYVVRGQQKHGEQLHSPEKKNPSSQCNATYQLC